jgi:Asp-tRNA(Asn)/Glu-tRNA(Gln) amidotransferase A subunit family amidase
MGRPWEEHTLLRAARVIEAAVPRRVPAHHAAVL